MPPIRDSLSSIYPERRCSQRLRLKPHRPSYCEEDDSLDASIEPTSHSGVGSYATPPATPTTVSPADVSPATFSSSDTDDTTPAPRSSHTRKRKEGHIPRPPNAFMFFRSGLWEQPETRVTISDNRQLSRIAGIIWNKLNDEQRGPYKRRAERAKRRHAERYPDYKYTPTSRPRAPRRRAKKYPPSEEARCIALVERLSKGAVQDQAEESPAAASPSLTVVDSPTVAVSTPELSGVLPDAPEEFVPTSDIPPLSLSGTNNEDFAILDIGPMGTVFLGASTRSDSFMSFLNQGDAHTSHASSPSSSPLSPLSEDSDRYDSEQIYKEWCVEMADYAE